MVLVLPNKLENLQNDFEKNINTLNLDEYTQNNKDKIISQFKSCSIYLSCMENNTKKEVKRLTQVLIDMFESIINLIASMKLYQNIHINDELIIKLIINKVYLFNLLKLS